MVFRHLGEDGVLGRIAQRLADALDKEQREQHRDAAGHAHQRHHDQRAVPEEDQRPVAPCEVRDAPGDEPQRVPQKLPEAVQCAHGGGAHRQQAEILSVGTAGSFVDDIAKAAHQAKQQYRLDHGLLPAVLRL